MIPLIIIFSFIYFRENNSADGSKSKSTEDVHIVKKLPCTLVPQLPNFPDGGKVTTSLDIILEIVSVKTSKYIMCFLEIQMVK